MKQSIQKYIWLYLQDCNYRYTLYDIISSVEIEFNLSFKKAKTLTINELKQLGEL